MTEGRCWEIKFKIEVSERHTESHNPVAFTWCSLNLTVIVTGNGPVGFNLSML